MRNEILILSRIVGIFFFISASFCLANVPIKLRITGTESITSFTHPIEGYEATLEGATSTGEYEWEISTATSCGEIVSSQGNHATVTINGSPTATAPLTARILCKAYYMDGNQRKSESTHIDVKWFCPQVAYSISGSTEVLEDMEETYTGYFRDQNNEATAIFEWSIGDPDGTKIEANPFITSFENKGNQTVTLYCNITAGDIHLLVEKEIHVHTYSMTVERWDYSGVLLNGKMVHTHSTVFDNVLMYIHYNVDNDDAGSKKDEEYDFEKLFFKSGIDDDLCELIINISVSGDNFDISDFDKSLTVRKTNNLRLWSSQQRKTGDLILGDVNSISWTSGQLGNILGKAIYVEGIERDSKGCIEISFGNITKKLRYATCSVGDKDDQPTKKERKLIKKNFENLIDCEWYVLRKENNELYNCIAFSVDPYQKKFENVDYINKNQFRSHMEINNDYPYPFWVNPVGPYRIPHPVNETDTRDLFWLWMEADINLWQIITLSFGINNAKADLALNFDYSYSIIPPRLYISGFEGNFKTNALTLLEYLDINNFKAQYFLNMNDFNPNGSPQTFDKVNDANAFFQSPVWKNNGISLTCCEKYDPNRTVTYYSEFHAARRAFTLKGNEKVEETNLPPGWFIFASKCGKWITLIHREEQICGKTYGQIMQTYKY